MKTEQTFMMLFRFTPNPEYVPTPEELTQMKENWGGFIGNIALSEKLVSTYQLGFEGKLITSDKTVSDGILIADNKTVSGNMVVKANSIEGATEMAKGSPILKMGGSVEVRNINPMSR